MGARVVVIQGHPDPDRRHYAHALADAYADGARSTGHEVRCIAVAALDFPLLRSKADFDNGELPPALGPAQAAIAWADHLVIIYPLWLGTLPALLKGFLEQVFRPGFAFDASNTNPMGVRRLKGKSARIIVTMGMPALFYRWYFRAHSLKSLERNVLHLVGIAPVRASVFGLVETVSDAKRQKWLNTVRKLGAKGR